MRNIDSGHAESPGFLIRRLQQISVSIFANRLGSFHMTPIQFTIMRVIQERPGINQSTLAGIASLDTSTTTDVVTRLAQRKFITRTSSADDRRTKVLKLTRAGSQLLMEVKKEVHDAQRELLSPLPPARRRALLEALFDLVAAHERNNGEDKVARPWRRL